MALYNEVLSHVSAIALDAEECYLVNVSIYCLSFILHGFFIVSASRQGVRLRSTRKEKWGLSYLERMWAAEKSLEKGRRRSVQFFEVRPLRLLNLTSEPSL